MVPDGMAKLIVLLLQQSHTLLKRFQKKLLTNAASLGMFPVAFAEKKKEGISKR
jgi:hypothetical protein